MLRTASGVNDGAQRVQALPAEGDVAAPRRAGSAPSVRRTAGLVALCTVALNTSIEDLLGRADQAGEDALQRRLRIERHAAHAVGADRAGRRRILRLREVAGPAARPSATRPRRGVPPPWCAS